MTHEGMACWRCNYWNALTDEWRTPKVIGGFQCRRHSPTTRGAIHGRAVPEWPETEGKDWCGDFEAYPYASERPK